MTIQEITLWWLLYFCGAWASYVHLKDLSTSWYIRLFALLSWLTFIVYLIACSYNDFEDKN